MGGSLINIPLQGKPAQFADPNEQMVQMAQLADLITRSKQQAAMAPYHMEAMKAEAEQRQMATAELRRQQKERTALSDALVDVGGDFFSPDLSKVAAKRGVSATTLFALRKQLDEAVSAQSKRKLDELNFDKVKDAEIADILETAKDPFTWSQSVDRIVKKGYVPPEVGAELTRSGFDPDSAARYVALYRGSSGMFDRAVKENQIAASKAAQASSQASARKTGVEADIAEQNLALIKNAKPEDYEAVVDQIVPPGIKENAALNARAKAQVKFALRQPDGVKQAQDVLKAAASEVRQLEVATDPRVQANKIVLATKMQEARSNAGGLVPKDDDPAQKYTLDDVPSQVRPLVENALKYQSPLPPQSRLNPVAQATRWWTMRLDPNYSEELFATRKAAVLSMNTGKDHQKLNAMNTVLGHVGRLEEAVDALQNGDIRVLNQIANELGVATGSSAPIVFKTIVHRVGPELTNAYVGSGGESAERKEAGGDFDVNGAPGQIKGAARITAKLLSSKMGSLLFDFKRAAHFSPDDPRGQEMVEQFFTPEAIDVMNRMFPGWQAGVEPGGGGKTGGGGGAGKKYVQYGRSADGKTSVGFTADGKLWNVNTGKELDPTTGREK